MRTYNKIYNSLDTWKGAPFNLNVILFRKWLQMQIIFQIDFSYEKTYSPLDTSTKLEANIIFHWGLNKSTCINNAIISHNI